MQQGGLNPGLRILERIRLPMEEEEGLPKVGVVAILLLVLLLMSL
jgi:hypothetical protein